MILTRKVIRTGNSMAISLPGSIDVPSALYVYTNGIYVLYSPVSDLESEYELRVAGTVRSVKRRYKTRSGKYGYIHLLTVPKDVARKMKMRFGDVVVVVVAQLYGEPAFLVVTSTRAVEDSLFDFIRPDRSSA